MKKDKVIMFLVSLIIFLGVVGYYYGKLSFSKYNNQPRKIIEKYFWNTYQEKITLISSEFYTEEGYYIWKYKYKDQSNIEFYEYYEHPFEHGGGGVYLFFDTSRSKTGNYGICDFYWQARIQQEYGEQLRLQDYLNGPDKKGSLIKYSFTAKGEKDIYKFAEMITTLFEYTFENVKQPSKEVFACDIKYQDDSIITIGMTDAIYDYVGRERADIFRYVFNRINMAWPMKYVVAEEDLCDYPNSIIVRESPDSTTGWKIIGDSNGYFEKSQSKDIVLMGEKLPRAYSDYKSIQYNSFLCIVEKEKYVEDEEFAEVDSYRIVEWYPFRIFRRNYYTDWGAFSHYMTRRDLETY